jgi:hypothetical protein
MVEVQQTAEALVYVAGGALVGRRGGREEGEEEQEVWRSIGEGERGSRQTAEALFQA